MIKIENKKYIIAFLLAVLAIFLIVIVIVKPLNLNLNNNQIKNNNENVEGQQPESLNNESGGIDLATKEGLLSVFKKAAEEEDYENFAKYLKMVYERLWDKDEDFVKIEGDFYMKITENYFDKGDVDKALEISTIIYDEVPQGWRFRYLRIRCLEKLGRDAYSQGDLEKAEQYAMTISYMMYRPEAANLLADVYIQKIEANLRSGDKISALNNLNFIWDYEVSQERRDKLIELKERIH